jgi:ketosteroid isomerase-like protein
MKKVLFFCLLCSVTNLLAQNEQQEINTQVWKPFIRTLNERDTKGFMSLHSKDVIRSPRNSKTVWNWDEYYQHQEKNDQHAKASGAKGQLDLRFTERIANENLAVEVGIFKYTHINNEGVAKNYFGRFHVVLRKEEGTWKILVDTDSSEGNTISEKDFLAASPME